MTTFRVRGFTSDTVLITGLTQAEAEVFVDDHFSRHGGVLLIEAEPEKPKREPRTKARYTCVVCGRKRTGRFIHFPGKAKKFTSRGWVCWRTLCNKEKA